MKSSLKYYIHIIFCILILSSCNTKVKNLIDLTPKLKKEIQISDLEFNQKITIESNNNLNYQPSTFKIPNFDNKFNTIKANFSAIKPLIVNDKLYFINTHGIIIAYQLNPWKKLWSYNPQLNIKHKTLNGGLTYSQGLLYITTGTRYLLVIQSDSGYELWRKKFNDLIINPPLVYDKKIILETISNEIFVINQNYSTIFQYTNIPSTISVKNSIKPIIIDEKLIISNSSGQLLSLNVTTKELLWQINFIRPENDLLDLTPINLVQQPIVDNNVIYLATSNGLLMKIDSSDGNYYWKREISDIQTFNKIGSLLFITTNAKQVAAISTDTAKIAWTTDIETKSKKPIQFLPPILINNKLFIITNNGKLYQLSPINGKILHTIEIPKQALELAVANFKFYIFTKNYILESK